MIQIFDSMTELLESVPKENMTFEMCNAFVKAWGGKFMDMAVGSLKFIPSPCIRKSWSA